MLPTSDDQICVDHNLSNGWMNTQFEMTGTVGVYLFSRCSAASPERITEQDRERITSSWRWFSFDFHRLDLLILSSRTKHKLMSIEEEDCWRNIQHWANLIGHASECSLVEWDDEGVILLIHSHCGKSKSWASATCKFHVWNSAIYRTATPTQNFTPRDQHPVQRLKWMIL